MKVLALFLSLLLPLSAYSTSPSADPKLFSSTRESQTTLSNGDELVILKLGLEAKPRILQKVKDLAQMENLPYETEELIYNDYIILKITFKNGLLLSEAIKRASAQLP